MYCKKWIYLRPSTRKTMCFEGAMVKTSSKNILFHKKLFENLYFLLKTYQFSTWLKRFCWECCYFWHQDNFHFVCFFMWGLLFYCFFHCLTTVWTSSENSLFHWEVHVFLNLRVVPKLQGDKSKNQGFRWECFVFLSYVLDFCRRIDLYEIIRFCVRCHSL